MAYNEDEFLENDEISDDYDEEEGYGESNEDDLSYDEEDYMSIDDLEDEDESEDFYEMEDE